jgi:hypothetical protein
MGAIQENRHDLKLIENFVTEEAKKRNVSVEDLLDQLLKTAALMNQQLPEEGRLKTAEGYVQTGKFGPDQADMLIRVNPVLPDEMRQLSEEIEETLGRTFRLEFPDYVLVFDPRRDQKVAGFFGEANWKTKAISLPTRTGIYAPIGIAHEKAHALHFEQSKLYKLMRGYSEEDNAAAHTHHEQATCIIEGWPIFVSLRYAELRDKDLGVSIYGKLAKEAIQWDHFLDVMNKSQRRRGNYEGARLFEIIYARDGFMAVYWAAMNLTTDEELYAFAQEEIPTGDRTPPVYV